MHSDFDFSQGFSSHKYLLYMKIVPSSLFLLTGTSGNGTVFDFPVRLQQPCPFILQKVVQVE